MHAAEVFGGCCGRWSNGAVVLVGVGATCIRSLLQEVCLKIPQKSRYVMEVLRVENKGAVAAAVMHDATHQARSRDGPGRAWPPLEFLTACT